MIKKTAIVFVLSLIILLTSYRLASATFFGEVETGLHHNEEDRYGFSYYIPKNYSSDRLWPLMIALHDSGGKGKDYIQAWIDYAEQRGVILLCPTYQEPREVSYDIDKRLLNLITDLKSRYEVYPSRIWIVGSGFGGHYGFYLGTKYPKEFTASASIGNGLEGILSKVFNLSYAEVNKVPALVIVAAGSFASQKDSQAKLEELKSQGYSVEVVEMDNLDRAQPADIYPYIFDWFIQTAKLREKGKSVRSGVVKEKFLEWVDGLFQTE
ncbi:MAG: hypothetical protein A3G33_09960 [Omnitrophica bacterium RIFCSPLOWO2_12_FULL_44_17]|uniref:Dienelactone hydrolase domain-containing protein n=1 Tax=Candidatus Danuiimicrobium aquiferis TaxID=1801832 RepID=A0A1G1L1X3_9BACT|nr:MAG: hypothetical protein A3B72_08650 [Omnitrophica bacterium RIFCSPHIGHO2_02_FULL_45_28]OGW92481.1 MAG: hypothetical protein A3E74_02305 [Omnitrophica bacterium RIFCSPHIGHO2_12_FULL_44_12]OGW99147.1 MAG: hypothetical protein A3G33_09960 [Omnitrophica bacterium RIFCSPLOWO2_12_FULL_44_17]OGX03176.1 MAG: hypothetical protein A3J12_09760 [Omnitrophica bacterium RIFCSPLOWO2_02_FULL_44_11]